MVGASLTSGTRAARLPLYVGGLMGPFGTGIMVPMIPELREEFATTNSTLAWGWALYLVPFAALMLVSGTLSERWGRRRTARWTFLLYGVATLFCAIAPSLGWFFAGRAVAGSLNAFFTPILLAALADATPPERLGEAVGVYAGFQSFGSLLAPLTGGLAADVNWRLAFVLVGIVSFVLSWFPPPGEPRVDVEPPPTRPLLRRPILLLGTAAFFAAAGPIGVGVVVGLQARDELGLSGSAAGLVLMAGPASAVFAGKPWGRVLDRIGGRRASVIAFLICSALVAAMAGATTALLLAIGWAVAGFTTNFIVVSVQSLAAQALPENRAGAISFVLAHRFLGHAVGALVWFPVFASSGSAAFLGSALVGVLGALAIVASGLGVRARSRVRGRAAP
jgi:MFS family permease